MEQEVEFVKCSPASNMTILVMDELPVSRHSLIASQMMEYGHLCAEQVGFVEKPALPFASASLRMAGGEFCGNACLALAACLAADQSVQVGEKAEFMLEVSGSKSPVMCTVEKLENDYMCEAAMPAPRAVEQAVVSFEGMLVELGIVRYESFFHLVIDAERFELDRAAAERLAKLLSIASGDGLVGVMLYRSSSLMLDPLIYVPALGSLIWEKGCGSGTASLGCYLAWRDRGPVNMAVSQPGGTIHVRASWEEGDIAEVRIRTAVGIVARGKAYVNKVIEYSLQGGL
jgi:diaminopimelate epimerase